jgi:uncharacterized protein DUF6429
MEIDEEKVDEAVLALLYLTTFKDKPRWRAWKGHSWDVLDRLHQKGYISDPATKAKSVLLSEEGAQRSRDFVREILREVAMGLPADLDAQNLLPMLLGFERKRLITTSDERSIMKLRHVRGREDAF